MSDLWALIAGVGPLLLLIMGPMWMLVSRLADPRRRAWRRRHARLRAAGLTGTYSIEDKGRVEGWYSVGSTEESQTIARLHNEELTLSHVCWTAGDQSPWLRSHIVRTPHTPIDDFDAILVHGHPVSRASCLRFFTGPSSDTHRRIRLVDRRLTPKSSARARRWQH